MESNDEPFYKTDHWFKFKTFQEDISGWLDYAVSSMELREISHFLVSPKYAYGELGIPGLGAPGKLLYTLRLSMV